MEIKLHMNVAFKGGLSMQKEKITRTECQIDEIKNFILNHGFKSISDFGRTVGMERQNLSQRIRGKCNPDIRLLLKWATVLKCDITELIRLFYPEEYMEYINNK